MLQCIFKQVITVQCFLKKSMVVSRQVLRDEEHGGEQT